jgi:hypothetical protein
VKAGNRRGGRGGRYQLNRHKWTWLNMAVV